MFYYYGVTRWIDLQWNFQTIIRTLNNLDGINLFAPGTQTKNEGIVKDAKENLLNHLNIQEQRGYILKEEILKNILPSISSYKNLQDLDVTYFDEKNSKDIQVNTSKEDWKETIKNNIEGDYFKIKYDYDSHYNITRITIQRIGENIKNNNEKNKNIKFDSNSIIDSNLISNIRTANTMPESNNYVFENNIKQTQNKQELEQFKIGFVYDENQNNFIPIKTQDNSYEGIKGYKIYSSGMQITLNKETKLQKKYYTMRINRYDSEFNILNTSDYKYIFEPVVTQNYNSNGEIVLELNFGQTYLLKQLKNIEIIFGSM